MWLTSRIDRFRHHYAHRQLSKQQHQNALQALQDAGISDLEKPDFNNLLHHLRGCELKQLPKGTQHFISVGCAGTWYFNWIEKCCGPIKLHTGIEYYSPKPGDLPAGVNWIANTAGDMSDIASDVGDILFSGQNIEHLWPADISAFLQESWRVLKPGGLLVIDSPNRMVTAAANWSHPEHTVELTPDEARKLIEASGFEVTALRGMWLCFDAETNLSLEIDQLQPEGKWSLARRITHAESRPDDSFCWWLVARKSDKPMASANTSIHTEEIFQKAWPERATRLRTVVGTVSVVDGDKWFNSNSNTGLVMCGPAMPLPAGSYSVTFKLKLSLLQSTSNKSFIRFEITDVQNRVIEFREFTSAELAQVGEHALTLDFLLEKMTFGIQFNVKLLRSAAVAVCANIGFVSHTDWTFNTQRL